MSRRPVLSGGEALSPDRTFTHIAPHPYNSSIELDAQGQPTPRLSVLSCMAIDATVQAWQQHPEAKLIIAGDISYPGLPTTTDLMIQRAQTISGIPDSSIIGLPPRENGKGYDNTYLQTKALADYFEEIGEDHQAILSVSLSYHVRRVMMTARAYGWNPNFTTAEDLLRARGIGTYDKYLPLINSMEKSERHLRAINRIDRRGRLLNLWMRPRGPRTVDIVEDDVGHLELIDTFATRQFREVTLEAERRRSNDDAAGAQNAPPATGRND